MSEVAVEDKKASETEPKQNDADALFVLGMRYSTGRDVEHDLIAAHKWFNLSAMMGHQGALDARADLAREMSTGDIAEAQRQARAWLWSRKTPAEEKKPVENAVIRPLYVRRKAQAMRSAKSFARICG